jgi:phage protein D
MNVRREVSWHDLTVERVVSAIARRYDLKPMISEAPNISAMRVKNDMSLSSV